MTNSTISKLLLEIFGGNSYHAQSKVAMGDIYYKPVDVPLDLDRISQHLEAKVVLGSYQLIAGSDVVRWLGWDVDSKSLEDARDMVSKIVKHLSHLPYTVEFSGGKGYHVLIFLKDPMTATKAKKVVDWVRDAEGFAASGDSHVECFPKQDRLSKARPKGNLLKLPLGEHPRSHARSVFVDTLNGWENGTLVDPETALLSKASTEDVLAICDEEPDVFVQLVQLLAQYWEDGKRHDMSLFLSGFLAHECWTRDQAEQLVEGICAATNDSEAYNRLQTVQTTFDKYAEGKKIRGRQGLGEMLPITAMMKLTELASLLRAPDTVMQIDDIRYSKNGRSALDSARLAASTMWSIMNDNGCRIFRTSENIAYWYDSETHEVTKEGSEGWVAILNHLFGLNPADKFSVLTSNELRLRIVREAPIIPVYNRAFFDEDRYKLFVNLGGPEVFILDGETIERSYNGECGYMFVTNEYGSYIEPDLDDHSSDAWDHLVNDLSFTTSQEATATPAQQKELLKAWILGFFFQELMPTKPILSLLGAPGSGKTTAMRRILRILEDADSDVLSLQVDKPDSFRSSLSKHKLLVMDNLEKSGAWWLVDMLNKLSTGSHIELRALYKTNVTYRIIPKCFVACTAVNMPFSDETLFSRLLVLEMEQLSEPMSEHVLQKTIREHGPAIWSDLLRKLNTAIVALKNRPTVRPPTKSRLVDFNVFCARLSECKALDGIELNSGLLAMVDSQLKQLKESSQAVTLIEEFLSLKPQEAEQWMTFQELFGVLVTLAQARHTNLKWKSALALSRHLNVLKDRLIQDFGAEFSEKERAGKSEVMIRFKTLM